MVNNSMNIIREIYTLNIVPCHRKCNRSFHFNGKQFPVCARCMGLIFGYLSIPLWYVIDVDLNFLMIVVLVFSSGIPMVLDGWTQLKKWRESNNYLRLFTGLLCSIGMSLGVIEGAQMIVELIKTIN
jgi:uncharacterized membrane protein